MAYDLQVSGAKASGVPVLGLELVLMWDSASAARSDMAMVPAKALLLE